MKMSGSIRQMKSGVRRFVASRRSTRRFALLQGAGRRAPEAHQSEPGFFFPVEPATVFCTAPKSAPSQHPFPSYCIPLERKSRFGAARSIFHE